MKAWAQAFIRKLADAGLAQCVFRLCEGLETVSVSGRIASPSKLAVLGLCDKSMALLELIAQLELHVGRSRLILRLSFLS